MAPDQVSARGERCRAQWLCHVFTAHFAILKGKNQNCKAVALHDCCAPSVSTLMVAG
jgi:hypothetical protein